MKDYVEKMQGGCLDHDDNGAKNKARARRVSHATCALLLSVRNKPT